MGAFNAKLKKLNDKVSSKTDEVISKKSEQEVKGLSMSRIRLDYIKMNVPWKRIFLSIFSLFLIMGITTLYIQVIPMIVIFMGGLTGVVADSKNYTDLMFWGLSSVGVLIPYSVGYLFVVRGVWCKMTS